MSTLDGPIWSRCSIALTDAAKSHFFPTLSRERWVQGWDERYRSSREGKNEEMKMDKRRAGEVRRQVTDFKEAVCCPSAVVQGAEQGKNEKKCPGQLGPSGRPTGISNQPKRGRGSHHHVDALLIGAEVCCRGD